MVSRGKCDRSVGVLEREMEPPAERQRISGEQAPQEVGIVSVSPSHDDHDALERCLEKRWILQRAFRPAEGMALLRSRHYAMPAVVCEEDLQPHAWKAMLRQLASVAYPPLLIVSSHQPDPQLWAEALNLGAYDVLAKPFDQREVARVLDSAWARWRSRHPFRKAAGAARVHRIADSAA